MAGSLFKMTATGQISCRMKKVYENKDCYDGDFINSMKHGFGLFTHAHGTRYYEGEFVNNAFSGYGVLTSLDEEDKYISYEGYFKNNLFHGQGVLTHRNGDVYTGSFQQSYYHGEGELVTSSSSQQAGVNWGAREDGSIIYTGMWHKGYPRGKMKIVYTRKGDVYEGQIDRFYHGEGRIEYRGGELGWYEGEFFRGKQQGKGIRVYMNGNRYEGRFHGGQIHGTGTMMYANGDKYSGNWEEGYYSGEGVLTYHNGDKYEGTFCRGKFRGVGLYTYGNSNSNIGSSSNSGTGGSKISIASSNNNDAPTSSNNSIHYLHHPPRHQYGSSTGTAYNINRRKRILNTAISKNIDNNNKNSITQIAASNNNTKKIIPSSSSSSTTSKDNSSTVSAATINGGAYDGDYKNMTVFHSISLTDATAPPVISSTGGSAASASRVLPLVDGQRHGLGHRQWLSGAEYYGEWRDGSMTGIGVLITTHEYNLENNNSPIDHHAILNNNTSSSSSSSPLPCLITKLKYEGGFLNGLKHGYGQEEFGNNHGIPYICPLGHRHCSSSASHTNTTAAGVRTTTNSSGGGYGNITANSNKGITRYEGEYQQGVFQGQGVLECGDGRIYKGKFVKGKRHGWGTQVYVLAEDDYSGHVIVNRLIHYTGEWVHNVRQGQGVAVYANGDSVEGLFVNGQPHGKIKYTFGNRNRSSSSHNNQSNHHKHNAFNNTNHNDDDVARRTYAKETNKQHIAISSSSSNENDNNLTNIRKKDRGKDIIIKKSMQRGATATAAVIGTINNKTSITTAITTTTTTSTTTTDSVNVVHPLTASETQRQVYAAYKHGTRLQWLSHNDDDDDDDQYNIKYTNKIDNNNKQQRHQVNNGNDTKYHEAYAYEHDDKNAIFQNKTRHTINYNNNNNIVTSISIGEFNNGDDDGISNLSSSIVSTPVIKNIDNNKKINNNGAKEHRI